ncbi:hypothetical protein ACQV5M_08470 [Leptospira sp. SA-E8]|uniref:hypothetical protein n=1 Tax=Leptospira sp. SA-E8 TaxID=3422259 RepID=UPI003EB82D9B
MIYFRIIFLFEILILGSLPVFSDTVRFKDGRSFKNVKSKIEGKTILIEKVDGSTQSFPIESLKTIEPGEIKKPVPKIADKKESIEPKEDLPKQEEELASSSPLQKNYYWVPFPFWSFLNSEPKQDLGIRISVGKGLSFLLAAAYLQQAESATTDREKLGQLILLRQFNQTGDGTFLNLALYRHQKFKEQVLTPISGETITKEEYTRRAEFSLGLFLFAVFLDGYFTFHCCSDPDSKTSSVSQAKLRFTPSLEYIGTTPQESFKAEMFFLF